jgi:hypothetical protein
MFLASSIRGCFARPAIERRGVCEYRTPRVAVIRNRQPQQYSTNLFEATYKKVRTLCQSLDFLIYLNKPGSGTYNAELPCLD